jgi:serine phosphatase RsbU (regulator of sigma subunit)
MNKFLFTLFIVLSQFAFSQTSSQFQVEIDSLQNIIKNPPNDTTLIDAYSSWSAYLYSEVPAKGVEIAEEQLDVCDSILGSRTVSKAEKDYIIQAQITAKRNIGRAYSGLGKHELAVENLLSSLDLAEQINDQTYIADIQLIIGNVYYRQGLFEEALNYFEMSREVSEKIEDFNSLAGVYINMGNVYDDQGDDSTALVFHRKGLKIAEEHENYKICSSALNNIAGIYYFRDEMDSALVMLNQSITYLKEINAEVSMAVNMVNRGELYKEMGLLGEAKKSAFEALEIANRKGQAHIRIGAYDLLYKLYKEEGNYKEALAMKERHISLKDSVYNDELKQNVLRQSLEYEYEKEHLADSISFAKQKEVDDARNQAQLDKEANFRYLLYLGLLAAIVVGILLFRNNKQKKKDNEIINRQKNEVEQKNQEITDSITYAKRIQQAILPPEDRMNDLLGNAFIYYHPKDIVAGDFYWIEQKGDLVIFAVADCTGHGVPGAMVSVVCHNALNRSVREFGLSNPAKILDKTNELVQETFSGSGEEVKDGMDISLCVLDREKMLLQFSGANNGLYHISQGILTDIKADKQPIGSFSHATEFSCHEIKLEKGDTIYLSSDGFPDQFGGENGKKLKSKHFKRLLQEGSHLPCNEQKEKLQKSFNDWKGSFEQLDDVCVMGIRF